MKIWIYLNGIQQGPYTFEQIKLLPIEPATPVWYDGLSKWYPAAEAPVTAVLFSPPAQPVQPQCEEPQAPVAGEEADGTPAESAGCAPQQPYAHPGMQQPYQQQAYQQQAYMHQPYMQPQYAMPQNNAEPPKRPSTYMVWCILLTICCCSPFALAGIVTGSISSSRYNSGDYEGAKRMSTATEWLLIISIVWSIIGLPVAWAFGL